MYSPWAPNGSWSYRGLLFQIFLVTIIFHFATAEPTAYEQLVNYGLPPGLLPPTVVSYKLTQNGHFSLKLSKDCYSTVHNGKIQVYYAPKLSGVIQKGKLTELKGISVKPPQTVFFWVSVTTIYVDTPYPAPGHIYFGVGHGIQESLDVAEFETTRICSNSGRSILYAMWEWLKAVLKIDD